MKDNEILLTFNLDSISIKHKDLIIKTEELKTVLFDIIENLENPIEASKDEIIISRYKSKRK